MKQEINKYIRICTFTDTSPSTDRLWKSDRRHHFLQHVFLILLQRTNEQLWPSVSYAYLHVSALMISKGDISASPSDPLCPWSWGKGFQDPKQSQDHKSELAALFPSYLAKPRLRLKKQNYPQQSSVNNCRALDLSARKVSDGALLNSAHLHLRSSFLPGKASAGGEHGDILEVF